MFDLRETRLSKERQILLNIPTKVKVRRFGGLLELRAVLGCEVLPAGFLGGEYKTVLFAAPHCEGGDRVGFQNSVGLHDLATRVIDELQHEV